VFGIRQVTRHLIDLGHRKIAYLGNALGGSTTQERERGFREEMAAAGFEVEPSYVHQTSEGTPAGGYAGMQYFLSLPARPTAIQCYNDNMAIGVYGALYEAGLRIPQDISVTGFDDITASAYLNPPLTTLRQHKYELGVGAARMMLQILEQDPGLSEAAPAPQKVSLRGELCVRASTAPPPQPTPE
jgi:DNA-binding LacI/PurR family transcriptional regulator